jgi:hypothetical protein
VGRQAAHADPGFYVLNIKTRAKAARLRARPPVLPANDSERFDSPERRAIQSQLDRAMAFADRLLVSSPHGRQLLAEDRATRLQSAIVIDNGEICLASPPSLPPPRHYTC